MNISNYLREKTNSDTMSSMSLNYRQGGYLNSLIIPLVAVLVLFVGAAGFGLWAFMERQDYKNNSDQKAAAAAADQKEATQAEDAAKYAEESKNPLKTFVGPSAFGGVAIQYPKTWSGYIIQDEANNVPLNAFFHPDVVPSTGNYALRIAIVDQPYNKVLEGYKDAITKGTVAVSAYQLPKVPSITGSRVDGEIDKDKQGSLVMFPIRNVTLEVWTEATQYIDDFNTHVLPNLSFAP
jgi:hypothetical protein